MRLVIRISPIEKCLHELEALVKAQKPAKGQLSMFGDVQVSGHTRTSPTGQPVSVTPYHERHKIAAQAIDSVRRERTIPTVGEKEGERPMATLSGVDKLVTRIPSGHSTAGYVRPDGGVSTGGHLTADEITDLVAAGILTPETTPKGKLKHYGVDADKAKAAFGITATMGQDSPPEAPIGRITRQEAAGHIEELLNHAGHEASVWTGGDSVRVYLKGNGYFEVTHEGTVTNHLVRQRGTIAGVIPTLDIEPLAHRTPYRRDSEDSPDDPMERLEFEQKRGAGHDRLELG